MMVLDTGILIYGIQGKKKGPLNKEEEIIIPRAQALLKELAGSKILIPAPAAWEFVLDFPVEEQPAVWALDWDDANRSIDLIQCLKHSTREFIDHLDQ